MKKVFLLLLAISTVAIVSAQQGRHGESRDVVLGQRDRSVYDRDHRGRNSYFSARERDEMIRRIYREYNWKIESVRHDRHLRSVEKRRQIRFLENRRDGEIREIHYRYQHQGQRGRRS